MRFDPVRSRPPKGGIWASLTLALLSGPAEGHDCQTIGRAPPEAVTASWYGREHRGRLTASGAVFDENLLTAAHPSLPLMTRARVTNPANRRTVEVLINDRGPGYGRGIDLSEAAARRLGVRECGLAMVLIQPIPSHLGPTRGEKPGDRR